MADKKKIKSMIYAKFDNKKELADKLGWTKQHLDYAMRNPERLRLDQYQQILDAIEVENTAEVLQFFLA